MTTLRIISVGNSFQSATLVAVPLLSALLLLNTGTQQAEAHPHGARSEKINRMAEPQVQFGRPMLAPGARRRHSMQEFDFGAPFGFSGNSQRQNMRKMREKQVEPKSSDKADFAAPIDQDVKVEAGPTVSGNRRLLFLGNHSHRIPQSSSAL